MANWLSAEIITTGTEILLGEIVDTNAAWIAQQLREIGVHLYYKTTVGDNLARIQDVLTLALSRSDVLIVTGGLGPTADDITRQAIAQATNRPLLLDGSIVEKLRDRFARWGVQMTANNQQQALIPQGAIIIDNPVGTAPGFIVESDQGTIIALPGVPREMKHLMTETVLPYLQKRNMGAGVIRRRVLRTVGIGESAIDQRIRHLMDGSNPTVGLAAHTGQADVRITARAENEAQAEKLLDQIEGEIRAEIGRHIYSTTPGESVESVVANLLYAAGATVAILETNTQGAIAHRLSGDEQNDPILKSWVDGQEGGTTPPQELSIPDLSQPLSEEIAATLAQQARSLAHAHFGVVVLGSGHPDEGLYGQRTGETVIGLASPTGVTVARFPYGGRDDLTAYWLGNRCLDLIRQTLLDIDAS